MAFRDESCEPAAENNAAYKERLSVRVMVSENRGTQSQTRRGSTNRFRGRDPQFSGSDYESAISPLTRRVRRQPLLPRPWGLVLIPHAGLKIRPTVHPPMRRKHLRLPSWTGLTCARRLRSLRASIDRVRQGPSRGGKLSERLRDREDADAVAGSGEGCDRVIESLPSFDGCQGRAPGRWPQLVRRQPVARPDRESRLPLSRRPHTQPAALRRRDLVLLWGLSGGRVDL